MIREPEDTNHSMLSSLSHKIGCLWNGRLFIVYLNSAYSQSNSIHDAWLKVWRNENDYVQAHGEFGSELTSAFGLDRTFMSVTTDPTVAQKFAGENGRVFEACIPISQLISQTLSGAGENEYLIQFGSGGFK